jgi:hypothetical protein
MVTNIKCTEQAFCSRCDQLTHHTIPAIYRQHFYVSVSQSTRPWQTTFSFNVYWSTLSHINMRVHAHIDLTMFVSFIPWCKYAETSFYFAEWISVLHILFTLWGLYNWNPSEDALWVMVLQELELQYVFRQQSHWRTGWHILSAKTYLGCCLNHYNTTSCTVVTVSNIWPSMVF